MCGTVSVIPLSSICFNACIQARVTRMNAVIGTNILKYGGTIGLGKEEEEEEEG